MSAFNSEISQRLNEIRQSGLYRELRRVLSPQAPSIDLNGSIFLNFSSNDYLGLANDPVLKESAIRAIEAFGSGSGASRLICGSLSPHHAFEEAIADFKTAEAALSFSSGYATALGTICALMGTSDVIILDKLVHASIIDAARLSGATLRIFSHNNLNELEDILKWADQRGCPVAGSAAPKRHTLVVTESVFSMDGDHAPLAEVVQLKEKYGAWLMVDEAHATGLYGLNRRGLAEQSGVADRIEVQMGTLGKALGSAGGYICGSRSLIEYLVNRARSFIFSTAPVPAATAAGTAAIQFIRSDEGARRCATLWQRVSELRSKTRTQISKPASAIIPIILGDEALAMDSAVALRAKGIFVPAIRYPTVARGQARLRVTVTAAHNSEEVQTLAASLNGVIKGAATMCVG
jgi:8-amino-7-oxononanoate synthase